MSDVSPDTAPDTAPAPKRGRPVVEGPSELKFIALIREVKSGTLDSEPPAWFHVTQGLKTVGNFTMPQNSYSTDSFLEVKGNQVNIVRLSGSGSGKVSTEVLAAYVLDGDKLAKIKAAPIQIA